MEVSPRIQICNLVPRVSRHIIYFTLVHALWRQTGSYGIYLTFLFLNQNACQRMSSSLEQHIPSLHEPLLHEFVAALRCLSRLTSSREEDAAFFVLHRHEVGRNLDVDDV